MLRDKNVMATVAVHKLAKALPFYEQAIGLKPIDESQREFGVIGLKAGSTTVLLYESEYAGTNKATVLTWALGDGFDAAVKELISRDVQFEHYDMPNVVMDGPIHVMGDMRVVWFKDPDGNIFSVGNY